MNFKDFVVTKSDGTEQLFSLEKYKKSLRSSHLSDEQIAHVVNEVKKQIYNKMNTQELYKKTFQIIKDLDIRCAGIYSLKEALRLLGHDGFAFEKLVSRILKKQGYSIKIDQILIGKCVTHEVDVLAYKNGKCILVECKFHNRVGLKSDIKVPLYIKSRFEDIVLAKKDALCGSLIATNTQFTIDAIDYARCVNIDLMAWGYPERNGIEVLIEEFKLYPITVLTKLDPQNRRFLLDSGIILCEDLMSRKDELLRHGFSTKMLNILFQECQNLCY